MSSVPPNTAIFHQHKNQMCWTIRRVWAVWTEMNIIWHHFFRRTEKWYKKVGFWLLEVSINNSYMSYVLVQKRRQMTNVSQANNGWITGTGQSNNLTRNGKHKRGRAFAGLPKERLDGRQHYIRRKKKGDRAGRCVVCPRKWLRKETTCMVHHSCIPSSVLRPPISKNY